jgi:uncharacterized integral membrane protein (TIGR00697 family)
MSFNIKIEHKYLMLLAMIYITLDIASKTLAYRILNFDNTVFFSSAVLIYPLTFVMADIITEVFGYKIGKNIVWLGFICDFIYAFVIAIVMYSFAGYVSGHKSSYDEVLGGLLRLTIMGVVGVLAGQFINMYILSKWKILVKGRYFWLRSIGSSLAGELVLSLIVCYGTFFGSIPTANIFKMVIFGYLIKAIYAILLSVPAQLISTALKRKCSIDIYDYNTNFNPFI